MNRREFLELSGMLCLPLTAGLRTAAAAASDPASRKANIVLIMADDLGWNELGCYGQTRIKTPNIDRLAVEGMRFSQFYSGSAVCAPSRCTLMTGKHGGHAFVRDNRAMKDPAEGIFGGQQPLPESELTIAEALKAAGYATGCFGKWGLGLVGTSGDPLDQGFDRFYGYNCQSHAHNLYPKYLVNDRRNEPLEGNTRGLTGKTYAPQRIADEMLAFVRRNKARPFFLYYPSVIPHLALQVPEEDLKAYRGLWPETPYQGKSYLPHPTPKACYAAMISFLDKQVGRLMALLKELGIGDRTVVLFTSDNGTTHLDQQVDAQFFNSVGPLRGLKGSLYEGGIRVPFVARWPGRIPPGAFSPHLAAHYDLPATLADLAGTTFPAETDGLSFVPTLLGKREQQQEHAYLFWDFPGYGGQIAVRMGKWKGIKKNLSRNPDSPLELYDLANDIGEKANVVKEHPDIAEKIERIMVSARTMPAISAFRFGRYPGTTGPSRSSENE